MPLAVALSPDIAKARVAYVHYLSFMLCCGAGGGTAPDQGQPQSP